MTKPSVRDFGIVNNPLLFTPFVENNFEGEGGEFSNLDMLFMDGEHWLLMDGEQLLSMNT